MDLNNKQFLKLKIQNYEMRLNQMEIERRIYLAKTEALMQFMKKEKESIETQINLNETFYKKDLELKRKILGKNPT